MSPSIRIAVGFFGVVVFCLAAMQELDIGTLGVLCGLALVLMALDLGANDLGRVP